MNMNMNILINYLRKLMITQLTDEINELDVDALNEILNEALNQPLNEIIDGEESGKNFVSTQEKILQLVEKFENVEKLDVEVEKQQTHLSDYITAKNIAAFCIFTGLVGLGFYLFYYSGGGPGPDSLSNSNAELYQSMSQLSKDLQTMDQKGILDALKKINEYIGNLSKEEFKILMNVKDILLGGKSGTDSHSLLKLPENK